MPACWKRPRYQFRLLLNLLFVSVLACSTATANDYPSPNRAVTIIVPYAPGGPGDLLARAVADALAAQTKGKFIIENKPGGSQTIGTRAAARAAPDGYTLFLGSTSDLAINLNMNMTLGYDPIRDFAPISLILNSPQYLITRPDFPANSVGELIDLAKRSPGKLTFASLGPGSTTYFSGTLLNVWTGISITSVPYVGAAPAFRDLVAGFVDMTYTTSVLGAIRSGQVKVLGATGATRPAVAPDIPAIAELGMPDFDVQIWMGLLAPAGTPKAIVDFLSDEIKKAVKSGAVQKRMGAGGAEFELRATTSDEFRLFIQREVPRWRKLIETAGALK